MGGGPAGSSCAWKLRRAGVDVLVLDRKAFPRDKTCAGWITPAVVESLQLDTDDYRRTRVFQPITGFRVGMIGGDAVDCHYGKAVSYGIRRCEFDHYLLGRCGARLRLGERLDKLESCGDGWIVNGSISASMLVGAGGHFCPVARFLGAAADGKELVVAAQEIEFEMSPRQCRECRVEAEVPELYFCRDLMGYAWCFRKGNFLNIGLGREDSSHLAQHVQSFCGELKAAGRVPTDAPEQFHGHAYILYGHVPREILGDAVLLIGDAAGLAYAQSGEGIRPAVESGLMAADVILATQGDYRRQRLRPYAGRLIRRFGRRRPASLAGALVPEPLKRHLAAKLLATEWFSRHIVLDRWFLHAHRGALRA